MAKTTEIIVRDLRKKDQYKIDDAYLNGYARLCGVYATAVYNSLSRHADFHTQECFPSIEIISEQHNISRPSVIKAIKELMKWGIVSVQKEKDEKTKRQKNNVYILTDKSQWKEKPSKRDLLGAESTSDQKPSKPHDESRVNDVYCKDNTLKDTHLNVSNASIALTTNEFIELFKPINPSYKRLFANTSERAAITRLIEQHGVSVLARSIKAAVECFGKPYAPRITTPYQLESKLGELIAFYQSKKAQRKNLIEL